MSRFFWSSNDPMGGFRTICPEKIGSSNHPMPLFNIYPTGPGWSSSIQPSNGLFFETMSRFFGSSNDPMGGFRTICPDFFGSSNHPMPIFNIYPTGPVWSSSIQPSNGLFFETMSRFFRVIQSFNASFQHISNRTSLEFIHPTIQWSIFRNYVPFFLGHPMIQWVVFEQYVPIFSGHPIIQCLFSTYIQQD